MDLEVKSCVRANMQPLQAHGLALTVDGLDRMPILPQLQVIHKPGVRLHVRAPHRDQPHLRRCQDARFIRRTVVAFVTEDPRARWPVNRQGMDGGQVMQRRAAG